LPEPENLNLTVDKLRVKHRPSLGEEGVHGRQNPQAAGCSLHPFFFQIDGTLISVPNPITWSVMKLSATRDRRQKSEDIEQNEEYRDFHREQAIKHARDVIRVVAMTTRDERDRAPEVVAGIRDSAGFIDAVEVCDRFFRQEGGWGSQAAARVWRDDDFSVIQNTLKDWFR
jgi:hypothetical protein